MRRIAKFGIILTLFASARAQAKFDGALPESTDIPVILLQSFKRVTGNQRDDFKIPIKCKSMTEQNQSVLGDLDPVSGFAYSSQPNSPFWQWYLGCVETFLKNDFKESLAYVTHASGPAGKILIGTKTLNEVKVLPWSSLGADQKAAVANSVLDKVIPFAILKEFGKNPDDMVQKDLVGRVQQIDDGKLGLVDAMAVMITVAVTQKELLMD